MRTSARIKRARLLVEGKLPRNEGTALRDEGKPARDQGKPPLDE